MRSTLLRNSHLAGVSPLSLIPLMESLTVCPTPGLSSTPPTPLPDPGMTSLHTLQQHSRHRAYSGRKSVVPIEQNHVVKKGALYAGWG